MEDNKIELSAPDQHGGMPLAQAMALRRSERAFQEEAVTLNQVSQLLWAAQGVTDDRGFRTAPSAGALYPLETYLVAGDVAGLDSGVYRYAPAEHALIPVLEGDQRAALRRVALDQEAIEEAPATFVLSGVYQRTAVRYGERAMRYVHIEAGHVGQNIALQAIGLNLGTVMIGAFEDAAVRDLIQMDAEEYPLYVIPFGRPLGE